jgi:hypothetical protein
MTARSDRALESCEGRRELDRGPDRDPHPATGPQSATHLRQRGRPIRKELQPLLADRDVEVRVRNGQSIGRSYVVVDRRPASDRRLLPRDREHRRAQIDARHPAAGADLDRGEPGNGSGPACNVDDRLAELEFEACEEPMRPGREQPRHEHIVIDAHGRHAGRRERCAPLSGGHLPSRG